MPKTWFSTPLSKNAKDTEGRIRNIFEGQRRRPAVLVLALAAAVALLCGSVVAVRAKRTVPAMEDRWEREKKEAAAYAAAADGSASLPAYVYQGNDPCLAAVCDWITSGEGRKYLQAEVTIPCPLIAEIDDSDPQDIRVWGNFWAHNYKAVGTTLLSVSGGECPGLLHLRAAENGYEVFDAELVGDGGAYAKDMRRIFGTLRMMKLDAIDGDALRAQYIADYVRWNDLPFTQYQDYGWDPVHIPGTPETPESAQIIHLVSPMGWSIDYDLREFSHDIAYDEQESLTGVGELQGVSMDFARYRDTDVESVLAELEKQMERPRREETFIGADSIPATLLRDAELRDEVLKGSYVLALNETDTLAVSVSNTYYAVQGDPVVPGADAALAKTLATFRLIVRSPQEKLILDYLRERQAEFADTYFASDAPAVPHEHDMRIESVAYLGEAKLDEVNAFAYLYTFSRYETGGWSSYPPFYLVLTQANGSWQDVISDQERPVKAEKSVEDMIMEAVCGGVNAEIGDDA